MTYREEAERRVGVGTHAGRPLPPGDAQWKCAEGEKVPVEEPERNEQKETVNGKWTELMQCFPPHPPRGPKHFSAHSIKHTMCCQGSFIHSGEQIWALGVLPKATQLQLGFELRPL